MIGELRRAFVAGYRRRLEELRAGRRRRRGQAEDHDRMLELRLRVLELEAQGHKREAEALGEELDGGP